MSLVLPFHTNIDLTWELSGSLRQPSALAKSDVVKFPLMLPSTLSYPMTAIQSPVRPSSPTKLGTDRGRLVFWLLTIEVALAFDLCSVTWGWKVVWKVGGCIFRAPKCVMFRCFAAYAFSFQLPSFAKLWRDPRCWSACIILLQLWFVGLRCFGRLEYGWSVVAFHATLWDDVSADCLCSWNGCRGWGYLTSGLTCESVARSKTSSILLNVPFFVVNSLILHLSPGRSPLQVISYRFLLACGSHPAALEFAFIWLAKTLTSSFAPWRKSVIHFIAALSLSSF